MAQISPVRDVIPVHCVLAALICTLPAVSTDMAAWYTNNLEEYYAADDAGLAQVVCATALDLFPRFRKLVNRLEGIPSTEAAPRRLSANKGL